MNGFENTFTVLSVHKTREHELIERAENERKAKSLREEVSYRVRNTLRINNDPIR